MIIFALQQKDFCFVSPFLYILKFLKCSKKAFVQRAEKLLKNGTLANRRMIIDQYIDKVVIYKDRIEVYMNLVSDYTVKEVIEQ